MPRPIRKNKSGFLPDAYEASHDLCFLLHDILVQLLKSGEESRAFTTKVAFRDEEDRMLFEKSPDIFSWLNETRRLEDRAKVLITTIFPAILSDTLHCIYEALKCSRKAKLNITYMLIRKPIQENLFLLESVVIDRMDFAQKLVDEPLQLRGSRAGGVEAHAVRIRKALDILGEGHRLEAGYLAQLRYDKKSEDGFDGICNHAMHLFTEHEAIRTDPMNINFIFSGWDEKQSQWSFLYSRLPYLLFYIYRLVEHIAATISPTHPDYIHDMDRRVAARTVLWWQTVGDYYKSDPLQKFVNESERWLTEHCKGAGYRRPSARDLRRMSNTGAYPGEPAVRVQARNVSYELGALLAKVTAR